MSERKIFSFWNEAKGVCASIRERGSIEFSTGLSFLDEATGGLHRGEVWVISGRTGLGKTTLAMNMAQKFADNPEHRILFCSLEMKGYELALRMFCEMTGTSYLSYMQGGLINPEHDKAFTEYLKAINFEIAEYGYTFEEVLRAIKEHFDGKKPDVVFIDYIQLVDWEAFGDERIAISLYSRRLAELAKKENIAVVVVSQLRRLPPGVTHSRPPELSDLKGSGSLEQDAHKVLFVYRVYEDGQEVPNYFINLAKNRQGPAPIDKLVGYDGKCYRFFDPEDNPLVKKVTETFGGSYEQKGS